ncbi:MAG: hypothetical protein A3D35_03695 [Candidatus Staskawiczbacteria bacterium RIFCSPHIGHO2_02_FULL_34_9]|uniref:Uncharacterized protein n=1 Tax=Candidatus Staskawiczbacteria bacterium RIFCSPHIGHO2_02_FULL_34_9 TaxID=1802206 RepID=A0A1G2HYV2_9BACT|nr:MAG: hypothetical protein A3D35_03695 [Candidatus Staskawiczbacteria bacterium RIFCSPHIGHO2_02_FULL_34_9]
MIDQNKKIKIIQITSTALGIIVISLLILGGSLLASKRWNPKWNPFNPSDRSNNSATQQI